MAKNFSLTLERFLGMKNSVDGSSELADGESPDMLNFRITTGFKLQKRNGYSVLFEAPAAIRGIWYGDLGIPQRYFAVIGNELFASETGFDTLDSVTGSVPGSGKVHFFPFCGVLYLFTGSGIRKFCGGSVQELVPYVPCVMIGTAPGGAGVLYEDVNMLTNHVRQTFTPDGQSTDYYLLLPNIEGIDYVRLNGVEITPQHYTWDEVSGCISFTSPIIFAVPDSLEIGYEVYSAGTEAQEKIMNCRFAMGFGGANDTRAFLYGNTEYPAMRFHSGIVDGEPVFEYFPETGYTLVGDGSAVTGMIRHYDRQLIFTEHAAYYSTLEYISDANGKLISSFPVFPLSSDKGNAPEGQALLVQNYPYTLCDTGLTRWVSTNIRDERNAKCISDAIAQSLQGEDEKNAILLNRKALSELWISFGTRVYIYNYLLDLFYYFEGAALSGGVEAGTAFYFYTPQNTICEAGGVSDNGEAIPAYWKSKKFDFGDFSHLKKITSVSLSARCAEGSRVLMDWYTEKCAAASPIQMDFSPDTANLMDSLVCKCRLKARHFSLFGITLSVNGAGNTLHALSLLLKGQITDTITK